MSTQRQWRRGTTTEHNSFTGAAGEVTVDTTRKGLAVHDATRAGGWRVPTWQELLNQAMIAADASGTDTITISLTPPPTAYAAYMVVVFKAAADNTGAVTINVNSLGAKDLKKVTSTGGIVALSAADLKNGGVYTGIYDGTRFLLVGGASGSAGGSDQILQVVDASASSNVVLTAFEDTYDSYRIEIEGYQPSTNGDLNVDIGYGGVPTYAANNFGYALIRRASNDAGTPVYAQATANTSIPILGASFVGGSSSNKGRVTFHLRNARSTTAFKTYKWTADSSNDSTFGGWVDGGGMNTLSALRTAAVTALKFTPASGIITAGKFILIGQKRAA